MSLTLRLILLLMTCSSGLAFTQEVQLPETSTYNKWFQAKVSNLSKNKGHFLRNRFQLSATDANQLSETLLRWTLAPPSWRVKAHMNRLVVYSRGGLALFEVETIRLKPLVIRINGGAKIEVNPKSILKSLRLKKTANYLPGFNLFFTFLP